MKIDARIMLDQGFVEDFNNRNELANYLVDVFSTKMLNDIKNSGKFNPKAVAANNRTTKNPKEVEFRSTIVIFSEEEHQALLDILNDPQIFENPTKTIQRLRVILENH